MTLVLDSSAALAWAIPDERDSSAEALLQDVASRGALVPGLWHLEVANVLLNDERRGQISADEVKQALRGFTALRISVDVQTWARAWPISLGLARQHGLSVYDASYLELAARSGLPLATRDKQLRRAAEECQVPVLA